MIYAVTGPDAYLVRTEIRGIRDRHDPNQLNTSTIDAKPASVDEIMIALGTPGFFGDVRVVIVNDLMTLSSKSSSGGDEDDDEPPAGTKSKIDWAAIVAAARPESVAVFVDRALWGIPAAVKKALPSDTVTFSGEPPRGNDLVAWMKTRAKAAGSSFENDAPATLAEVLCPGTWQTKPNNPAYDRPPDLERFANEIDKLALASSSGVISKPLIVEMTAASQADRLFPLIDAVIAGDGHRSANELATALAQVDDAPRIMAQLNQQAELLAALSVVRNAEPGEIARALGVSNPGRISAIQRSLGKLKVGPRDFLEAAVEIDRAQKSGQLRHPNDALYVFIERATNTTRKGDN